MNKLFACVAMAATAFALLVAPASADSVECPLTQARRAVTNTLPSDWYTTPIVSALTGARLQTIAGEQALVCLYGEAGQVQRVAPRGQTCTARTGGFDCRAGLRPVPIPVPVPIPTPLSTAAVIQSQGDIALRQTYMIDLETGAPGAGADIWFEAATATEIYLSPRNGARFLLGDLSVRGRTGCGATSTMHYSADRIALSALPVGSSVCVRTNEGHYAEIRIAALTPTSPRVLSLHYVTWRN